MKPNKFQVFYEHERFSGELKVYIFANESDGRRSIITNLTTGEIKTIEPHHPVGEPTFRLGFGMSEPFMQAMANELYKMGIKAEEAPVLANELVSTKYHLEDMRALVFENNAPPINVEIKEEKK